MMIVVELMNFKILDSWARREQQLKQEGIKVKYVWLDNAGENKAFANIVNSKDWNLQLTFEFTSIHTPQRNCLVEVDFATLWCRLRALFHPAFVPEEEKYKLVREGIHHLTFLDGLIVKELNNNKITEHRHRCQSNPKLNMPMRVWGEAGIVKWLEQSRVSSRWGKWRNVCWIYKEQHRRHLLHVHTRVKHHSRNKGRAVEHVFWT
jgi:hypothetical protein